MAHPVIHVEIRSGDPDATRQFFGDLFGWKVASEGGLPGYTFIDTGSDGGPHTAISPRQSSQDEVLFFVAVEDVAGTKGIPGLGVALAAGASMPQTEQKPSWIIPVHPGWGQFIKLTGWMGLVQSAFNFRKQFSGQLDRSRALVKLGARFIQ